LLEDRAAVVFTMQADVFLLDALELRGRKDAGLIGRQQLTEPVGIAVGMLE
jgi:hypothetical protein